MELVDREKYFNIRNHIFLVFCWSYYFNLVSLVDQCGFPSMPMREIVENRLKEIVEQGDC